MDRRPAGLQSRLHPPGDDLQLRLEHGTIRELQQGEASSNGPRHHGSQRRVDQRQPNDPFFRAAASRSAERAHQRQTPYPSAVAWRIPCHRPAAQAGAEPGEERVGRGGEALGVLQFGRRCRAPIAAEDPGGSNGENGHDQSLIWQLIMERRGLPDREIRPMIRRTVWACIPSALA